MNNGDLTEEILKDPSAWLLKHGELSTIDFGNTIPSDEQIHQWQVERARTWSALANQVVGAEIET